MTERLVSSVRKEADAFEASIRPQSLDDFVGQEQARANLRVFITAARGRGDALDHVLFAGPPGLGKTTLAQILSKELGVGFRATSGPVISKAGDLAALLDSPVIALNRAVAIGMAEGPRAALAIVDGLADVPALKSYHLLPSVRGDLLYRLGRFAEAHTAFEAAAALAGNTREREFLKRRAAAAARAAQDQDGRTDPSIA